MSTFNPQDERQLVRDFVLHYLKDDGVFVTRLLSINSSDLVVTEIINQLWLRFKNVNRLYSSSTSPQNPNSNDNLNHFDTSINHRRAARIPPPPLPIFMQKTNKENTLDNVKSAKDTDV